MLIFLYSLTCDAQVSKGIIFEENLSWLQLKEKAKKEKKYIFVDIYTTWCAPCRQMDRNIFPQKKVGEFFNNNFLNLKVQIDRTKKDSEKIKKWYTDAKEIENTFKIKSYPTYLFLNPNGELVHEINGGTENADEFISKACDALKPETQYTNLKKEYANGKRDTSFLKLLIATATSTYDFVNARIYMRNYLITQKNLHTTQNIQFIAASLESSKDIGYEIILNQPKEVISIIGSEYRNYILNTIAFDEDILPMLRIDGKKEISGMMVNYSGELNKNVDWTAMQLMLNSKYKDRSEILMVHAKTTYYKWTGDWSSLNKTLLAYTNQSKQIEEQVICDWLHYFVSFGKQEYFANALQWANSLLSINKNSTCIKNYGILLYKAGKTEEAINIILAYKEVFNEPEEATGDLIVKMKSGKKIE